MRKMIKEVINPIDLDQNKIMGERDVHVSDIVKRGGAMIKNHGRFETCYEEILIVYLVRDGRDSVYSYYHYNVVNHNFTENWEEYFERVIVDDKMVTFRELNLRNLMGTWGENVRSYLSKDRVKIIKYEDAKKDTMKELCSIFDFVGMKASRDEISSVISKYEEKLRAKRKHSGRPRGKPQTWKQTYTERQDAIFCDKFGDMLERFGYETCT